MRVVNARNELNGKCCLASNNRCFGNASKATRYKRISDAKKKSEKRDRNLRHQRQRPNHRELRLPSNENQFWTKANGVKTIATTLYRIWIWFFIVCHNWTHPCVQQRQNANSMATFMLFSFAFSFVLSSFSSLSNFDRFNSFDSVFVLCVGPHKFRFLFICHETCLISLSF